MMVSNSDRQGGRAVLRDHGRVSSAARPDRSVGAVLAAIMVFGSLAAACGPARAEVVSGDRINQPSPSVRESLRAHRRDGPAPEFKIACWQEGQLILEEEGYDDFRRSVDASTLTLELFNRSGRAESLRVMSIGETTCAVYSNTLELPALGGNR